MAGPRRIHPVILSGGSGTRLWPLSRALHPKQLLPLLSERTLLQETLARVDDTARFAAPLIVANAEHRFVIAEQLRESGLSAAAIVLEPEGRNTAPAAAVAALMVAEREPDGLVLLLAADHAMRDVPALVAAIDAGRVAAEAGDLVLFGITPDRPETGYGYVRVGPPREGAPGCRRVGRFVEKPSRAAAEAMLAGGDHLWNASLFLFRADIFLAELGRLAPDVLAGTRAALAGAVRDLDFIRLDRQAFAAVPSISIDYAVMEKTDRATVVPVDPGWSDIGSWSALWDVLDKDAEGNVLQGDVTALASRGSLVRSEGPLVVTVGIRDLVVAAASDAVLVLDRAHAQDVKLVVEGLRAAGRAEAVSHPVDHRPWGHFRTVDAGDRYQVKRIEVRPGGRLSLQRHRKRSEHWVVIEGRARVTRDGAVLELGAGESVHVPLGAAHRLENPGETPLVIVEVQTGEYVGEDDIERLDDSYGRA